MQPHRATHHERQTESPRDAIERLASEHAGTLYAIATRLCGNRDEAEDLVQQVFLNAQRAWPSFRHDASEKTWLFRIATNACQRMHRKRAGEPEAILPLDNEDPANARTLPANSVTSPDALEAAVQREAQASLEAAIASLPPDFRMPLILKDIAGFSAAEIAPILALESATVRSRVHRARLKLRAAVETTLPKSREPAPAPAYDKQTCLDLLDAKQNALDRGVPLDTPVLCERCRSVFATLDLNAAICHQLASGTLPQDAARRLADKIRSHLA